MTVLIVAATPVFPVAAGVKEPPLEQAVKASYLFKFAPFVTWPDRAFAGPSQAFTICLIGEDPFGVVLDDVVQGQKISGHPIAVRRLGSGTNKSGCHILFAGRSPQSGDYAPFSDIAGHPVLTVTDAASGASGAMIRFVKQVGRIRFQIDDSTARANGLVISSKLLSLAISVDRQ